MTDRVRPYLFYDVALSICTTCFRKIDASIVFEDGRVVMIKRCPDHGIERVLVADDVEYYRRCREVFIKTPEMPRVFNRRSSGGVRTTAGCAPIISSIRA